MKLSFVRLELVCNPRCWAVIRVREKMREMVLLTRDRTDDDDWGLVGSLVGR